MLLALLRAFWKGNKLEQNQNKNKRQLFIRQLVLFIVDVFVLNASVILALLMRFDVSILMIPDHYAAIYKNTAIIYTAASIAIFWFFRLYHSLWRYASISELYKITLACLSSVGVYMLITLVTGNALPKTVYFMQFCFLLLGVTASRFIYRMVRMFLMHEKHIEGSERIMIIGAGESANTLIREFQDSRYLTNQDVICLIDDDSSKWGRYVRGVKVVGGRDSIKENAKRYKIDQIIFAIPSLDNVEKSKILNICKDTDCELKSVPGVYQMVDGEINVKDIKNVDVLDLLGRDPITVDMDSIMGYVSGKTVLVTGGGGSIGSELCRQIAGHNPHLLIIFDIYENNAYDIQQELKKTMPNVHIETLIGSVRNEEKMDDLFRKYHPDIVYHAAAHKHVPLMEDSPNEAVKNNVIGTWNVAKMADRYRAEKFVLISTDKAVNPTNVMGATKRICEMIVQMYAEASETEFVAVRFGNVLGSNGSVIPLFKKQIEAGGPVTVTHPDIIRYFMTIPEAVSLVLQAGAYAKGGEIFVLDMGDPVKIDDLAKNLIRLSGYTLGVDMNIEYTGLRPGEKLYEELLMDEEGLQDTENKLIHIGKPIVIEDKMRFYDSLIQLKILSYSEIEDIRPVIMDIVPTFHPNKH